MQEQIILKSTYTISLGRRHGVVFAWTSMSSILKAQIDWIPLAAGVQLRVKP